MRRLLAFLLPPIAATLFGSPHEPPTYADDWYTVGAHQAMTQQLCHDNHGTVIHTLIAAAAGTFTIAQGNLAAEGYTATIVRGAWMGVIKDDWLIWSPSAPGDRIVVTWAGAPCLVRLPVMSTPDKKG